MNKNYQILQASKSLSDFEILPTRRQKKHALPFLTTLKKCRWQILFVLCLLLGKTNTMLAQQVSIEDQLRAIATWEDNTEFIVIKPGIHFTKEDFVRNYLPLLQIAEGSEMKFIKATTNDIGVTTNRYEQYFQGYKVMGGEMIISEQHGRVKYVSGMYMQNLPLNTNVVTNEEQAKAIALSEIQSTDFLWMHPEAEAAYRRFKKDSNATYKTKPELIYTCDWGKPIKERSFRLTWKYSVHVNPQPESYTIFIDAETGKVVNKIPLVYECSGGNSTTLWNGAQTIYTQLNAGTYRTLGDCNSAQIHTYNGNGNDNGVGATYYTDADNAWPNTALGKYIAQTHWGSKETRDYYFNIHGRNGYDDAGADYISYINPGYTGNAYWTGAGTSFGGSSSGADPYVTLDVSGHEHTHGVIDFTSNLTYSYESGALNESFADCIGEAVEAYALGTSTNWIHRHEIGGGNRSLINPNAKGDPDTYLGTNWYVGSGDAGGVHTNSGVQNFWFYLLSEGGSGTNDNGNAYNVSGIGINKARLITYDNMVSLASNAQYSNSRSNAIQKAKDRYGDCSNEAEQTTHAWRAVGVGAAFVPPAQLFISVTTSATSVCTGGSVTLTASGASTYSWSPGGSGNPLVYTINNTTTFTVTGTNAEQCTGSRVVTVYENQLPTVSPTISDNELCSGESTSIFTGANQTLNELITDLSGTNGNQGNAFDIQALKDITITDFKMNILSGDSAQVWYKSGGYGNADITTNTGWTKLGATVPITPAGAGALTTIPTTSNITIPSGSTYGFIVICNGSNRYDNGTLVGLISESNTDLRIREGHGGFGYGGTFNFTNSPRVFNGSVVYRVNLSSYSWAPAATVTSPTSSSSTINPVSSTSYTVTVTDDNGCTGSGFVRAYMYSSPFSANPTATPSSICIGNTTQLNSTASVFSNSQILTTPLDANNGFEGNVFDITAVNQITITNVRMVITTGDSAQVWYKPGGYGGVAVTSNVGWTKLGNTVAITPAGAGALTLIPTTANLVIPAGQTYGILVTCNGSNDYTNGTAVGNVLASSPDLIIKEGHGGSGFSGVFNYSNSPRNFNGQIDYNVTNTVTGYSWSPNGGTLSNSFIQNPVADPTQTTTYTVTLTDIHNCTLTDSKTVYVNPLPGIITSVSPNSICPGDSAQIITAADITEDDSLFTTLTSDNNFQGNAFDITFTKAATITDFKMQMASTCTQAEVWYKIGGYGGANLISNVGWTKLGATVAVTSAGVGNLTRIPTTANLSVSAGQTIGFVVVANNTVYYLNGTSVGATASSNPDLTIKEGHGGSGIGGTFNFTSSPRIWSGEIIYTVNNGPATYSWSPNTNMSNSTIANPKAAPLTSTVYNVTVTDANGCSNSAPACVVVSPLPTLGNATATPPTLCLGANVNLNYTQPGGLGCFGAVQAGFAGTYAPSNWTTSLVNSNGTVNTAGAPSVISVTSSNGLSGSGQTNYTITVPCSGIISFNWSYVTTDSGPQYDAPKYSINGGSYITLPGFIGQSGYPKSQVGSFCIPISAGQTFSLQMHSSDNLGGAATTTFSSFKAPYQTTAGQSVVWYSASVGGSNLGNGNPQTHTPATSNTFTYYAQVSSSVTGCTNTSRVATNSVAVNAIPNVTANATSTTICQGSSTTLNGGGANTYVWNPGGISGNSISVSPASTTTYTVTGTSSLGCTKTSTVTINVNPAPNISGSASPSIVCPGSPVTLTGTNAGATYNWQPGNLNSASGVGVVVNPTATTTYTVTATYGNGCTRTQTFVILMHPTPTVTTSVAPSATICAGSSATITANSTTATGYTWQPGGGGGANLIVTLANTYTVTATNAQGCTGTATQIITVLALPNVTASASATTICQGSSSNLTGGGAASYVWNPGGLSGSPVSVSPASTTTYTVIGTSANGCTKTSTVTINVNPAAAITGSATPGIVCPGGSVTLVGTNAGATYNWQPGNLNTASGVGVIVNPFAQTTYTVTATYGNGCSRTSTFVVLMHPTPSVTTSVLPVSGSICAGNSATITANSATATGYTCGGGANLIVTLANTYTVTATNAQGCTATATRVITVNSLPTVNTSATSTSICVGGSTSLSATGAVSYVWNPGALSGSPVNVSPASTTTYTVIGTNANGCTNTATRTITVAACSTSTVTVKAYIQGYYIGAGFMTPVLANQGVGVSGVDVDNVTIELHNTSFPFATAHTFTGMLKTNGNVVCSFPGAINGSSFYIVFKHRNAIQTWSKNPVLMSNGMTYDFTNAQTKAFGDNQISLNVANTIWGMYSGDINQDENMDLADFAILEAGILNFDFGYQTTDLDGNGNVELADAPYLENNINSFIFSAHP